MGAILHSRYMMSGCVQWSCESNCGPNWGEKWEMDGFEIEIICIANGPFTHPGDSGRFPCCRCDINEFARSPRAAAII